ncbi:hypothetical protein Drorol1_Dr00011120 [Drosera rotundifolia]
MPLNQIHHQYQTLHHHHHHDPYPTRPAMDNNPQDLPSPSGTRKVELQGPRPTPLRVSKDSHKITKHKPPLHPKHHHQHHRQETVDAVVDNRQPVIIYAVSPKVIHADPSNFMSIVQRLTGNTTTTTTATTTNYNDEDDTGDFSVAASRGEEIPISPAARFAAIERATISPSSQRGRNHQTSHNDNGLMGLVGFDEQLQLQLPVPVSAATGILSPAPGNLPVISSAMFSPAVDMQAMFGVQDVQSPLMFGHSFLASPTGFLSPTLSPTLDFSNLFGW